MTAVEALTHAAVLRRPDILTDEKAGRFVDDVTRLLVRYLRKSLNLATRRQSTFRDGDRVALVVSSRLFEQEGHLPQLTAFFTSAVILCSSASVNSFLASDAARLSKRREYLLVHPFELLSLVVPGDTEREGPRSRLSET